MNKKTLIPIVAVVLLFTVLAFVLPNLLRNDKKTDISTDVSEHSETACHTQKFDAVILEINDDTVFAKPISEEPEVLNISKVSFNIADLNKIDVKVGSSVRIFYEGDMAEASSAPIKAVSWDNTRNVEYTDKWLDKTTSEKHDGGTTQDIIITRVYSNCFFGMYAVPLPYEIKLNGKLPDEWCVGDQVVCTYNNYYEEGHRIECDFLTVKKGEWSLAPGDVAKPVIYLYPEEEREVSVNLAFDGELTCTYPKYDNGWTVTASPDGTLTDGKGQTYNYLYWEGKTHVQYDLTEGFCVKGEDTARFLEDALESLGLNRKEANEFIVYWLPLMEQNPYNIISFQRDVYTGSAKLEVSPTPDTLIRVFMAWQKSDTFVEITEQKLSAPSRSGFTVVEWGGTEVIR